MDAAGPRTTSFDRTAEKWQQWPNQKHQPNYQPPPQQSAQLLGKRLGGATKLIRGVMLFNTKLKADASIAHLFERISPTVLNAKHVQLLRYAVGGPAAYCGPNTGSIHQHLFAVEAITCKQVGTLIAHLAATLEELQVEQEVIADAVSTLSALQPLFPESLPLPDSLPASTGPPQPAPAAKPPQPQRAPEDCRRLSLSERVAESALALAAEQQQRLPFSYAPRIAGVPVCGSPRTSFDNAELLQRRSLREQRVLADVENFHRATLPADLQVLHLKVQIDAQAMVAANKVASKQLYAQVECSIAGQWNAAQPAPLAAVKVPTAVDGSQQLQPAQLHGEDHCTGKPTRQGKHKLLKMFARGRGKVV